MRYTELRQTYVKWTINRTVNGIIALQTPTNLPIPFDIHLFLCTSQEIIISENTQ